MTPFALTSLETRVLGCLLEKEHLTPENYPLSLHSLTAACNQSTNRDPVVSYEEKAVEAGLNSLREKKLASVIFGAGSRVQKYRHKLLEHYTLSPAEVALLCVLLLRGPQTPGELRSRAERMHSFESVGEPAILPRWALPRRRSRWPASCQRVPARRSGVTASCSRWKERRPTSKSPLSTAPAKRLGKRPDSSGEDRCFDPGSRRAPDRTGTIARGVRGLSPAIRISHCARFRGNPTPLSFCLFLFSSLLKSHPTPPSPILPSFSSFPPAGRVPSGPRPLTPYFGALSRGHFPPLPPSPPPPPLQPSQRQPSISSPFRSLIQSDHLVDAVPVHSVIASLRNKNARSHAFIHSP